MKNSLQVRLSLSLSVAILGVALIAGAFTFFWSYKEAYELQDTMLRQVATLYDHHRLVVPLSGVMGKETDTDSEMRLFVQLLTPTSPGSSISNVNSPLALPSGLIEGLQTVRVSNENYRVLVRTLSAGERLAVSQEIAFRDEVARGTALHAVMPFLILVPVLLVVVAVLVRQVFKPIAILAIEIDCRGTEDLHEISSESLPSEVQPFVTAINRLLKRVDQSMQAQRRFIADAAHELRSPLTALSLQADRLAEVEMPTTAQERLMPLRQGIARSRSLLDQLLSLARAHLAPSTLDATVSIQQVFRRVLEDMVPLAQAKNIDIGIVGTDDTNVLAQEVDLITLVKNLVDNAIRYTPSGGRVDLTLVNSKSMTLLIIEDNGPGIPETEWERVFDPFYRVLGSETTGSGLGLSIVQTIAARIGAKVNLDYTNGKLKTGLRVRVVLPSKKS